MFDAFNALFVPTMHLATLDTAESVEDKHRACCEEFARFRWMSIDARG
jgi:hypothetical protein